MKGLLDFLDKTPDDALTERMGKEPVSSKYWMFFGISIFALLISALLNFTSLFRKNETPPADLYSVVRKDGKLDESTVKLVRVTLPSAHNTIKNVTAWIKEAIGETYSFGFLNFDKQVKKASLYFTEEGYAGYLRALEIAKIRDTVVSKKLEISILPLKEPILINSGMFRDEEYWRFKTPVLVNYFGGKEPIREKYMLEILIRKVPSYVNPKSLAIHEYIMTPM
jgi:Type-IV b secretion system, inner-membrane complex component